MSSSSFINNNYQHQRTPCTLSAAHFATPLELFVDLFVLAAQKADLLERVGALVIALLVSPEATSARFPTGDLRSCTTG